jgi:transposase
MEAIIQRCCGIDVHKKTIVACLMVGTADEKPQKTIKTFSTMTRDLLACKDWLESEGCTYVAMERSGVYWKPVFNILEDSMEVILANARHIKNVPGRKTDVKDCEWIAQLLRYGLIKGSFIPPKPIRELRDLTRYRRKLIQTKSSELNRIHKVLEDANIKLSSVVSDYTWHICPGYDRTPDERGYESKGDGGIGQRASQEKDHRVREGP